MGRTGNDDEAKHCDDNGPTAAVPSPSDRQAWSQPDEAACSEQELDRMFDALSTAIEQAPKRPLAELPTRLRYGLVLLVALGAPVWLLISMPAGQPMPLSLPAHLAFLGLYAATIGLLSSVVLRPFYRPGQPRRLGWVGCGLALVLVLGVAVWPASPASLAYVHGAGPLPADLSCLLYGSAVGAILFALLRLVDRGQALGLPIAACSAALFANACLQAQCPDGAVLHRLNGHASLALLFLLGVLLAQTLRRLRRDGPRSPK